MTLDDIKQMIKNNEGLRLTKYKDSLGYATIGYGHKLTWEYETPDEISLDYAEELFEQDFEKAYNSAKNIPSFDSLGMRGKAVLIDMTYNMGPNWYKKWPKMMSALERGDLETAADELLNSRYAKQVKTRAKRNANLLRNGFLD